MNVVAQVNLTAGTRRPGAAECAALPAAWLLLLWLALNPAAGLRAQEFDANHPELRWETIETEHFLVHYHQGTQRTANLVAEIAEDVYPSITGLYQYRPGGKVEFVIRDTEDYSNGGAYFFDNKIEIWAENLDYVLRGTHNWLRDVVTHEFTHIVSIQKGLKFTRHVPAGWVQVFGYEEERRPDVVRGFPDVIVSYPISGVTIPVWFAEGVAQFQSPTRRFDYRDSHREMILRDRVITGNLLDLKQMGTFGKNSIGNESSYNQGFSFVKFLAESFGDSVVSRLADKAGSPLRINFNQAMKSATGVGAGELYRRWKTHLEETYSARLQTVQAHLQTGEALVSEGIGNLHPTLSPDGRKLAYLATGEADYLSQNTLIVEDLQSHQKQTVTGKVTGSMCWSPDGRYLAYARVTPEGGTGSLYNDLFVYDLQEKSEHRLTRSLRARHPHWSHDGGRLAFVVESDGMTDLFTLQLGELTATLNAEGWQERFYDLNEHIIADQDMAPSSGTQRYHFRRVGFRGEALQQLTHNLDGRQIYHPRWSPDDSYLVFDTSVRFGRDIAKIPAAGGEMSLLLAGPCDERYPVFQPGSGKLIYASDETGIFNIYSYDLQTGEKEALTNVAGGAFMPTLSAAGDLYYSLYINQGYKIYGIGGAPVVNPVHMVYLEDYESRIPHLAAEEPMSDPLPPRPYKSRFSGVSLMPRVLIDYGTVKPGLYVSTNEMLNKMFFFGGFDVNSRGDYDIFSIFEFNLFKPTFFVEAFNQTANISDVARLEGYNVRPKIDINFNLLEANVGLQGRFLPFHLDKLFYSRLAYTFSLYRAKIGTFSFTDPASGELFIFAPLRYTYLRAHTLSLLLKHESVPRDVDRDINPRHGRYFTLRVQREWNRFLNDFATDRVVNIEQFKKYYVNRYELNWEEYLKVPGTSRHSLTLRLQGGLIDAPVDSFFHFFGGGLVGLKGYPFYSIEGRRMALGSVTYRLPLVRNLNTEFLNVYFDKLYLGGFFQYGNAWSRGGVDFNDFLSDVGIQLRLDTFSWYFFPTRIFVEAAYPLKEHINQGVRYPQEWKFYAGVLFDFDLRLEKRRR